MIKIYFDKEHYNNNKNYERYINKFMIYLYLYICAVILITQEMDKSEISINELVSAISECCATDIREIFTYKHSIKL